MDHDVAYMIKKDGEYLLPEQSDRDVTDLVNRLERFAHDKKIPSITRQTRGIDGRILQAEVRSNNIRGTITYKFPTEYAPGCIEAELNMSEMDPARCDYFMGLIGVVSGWK